MKQENEVKILSQEELDKIYEAQVSTYEKLLGSGKYKDLLLKLGMNGCSLNNLLYLLSQNADATVIKNAKDWEKTGRKPLPKATPLKLMAPVREGEKNSYADIKGFQGAEAYDISQTKGKDYMPFRMDENLSDENKRLIVGALRDVLNNRRYSFEFVNGNELSKGTIIECDALQKKLKIKRGLDNRTLAFELAVKTGQIVARSSKPADFEGFAGKEYQKLEGDSIACILAARYGRETKNFDFSIVDKMDKSDYDVFRENLHYIYSGAKRVMDGIDRAFAREERRREYQEKEESEDSRCYSEPEMG